MNTILRCINIERTIIIVRTVDQHDFLLILLCKTLSQSGRVVHSLLLGSGLCTGAYR